MSQNQVRSTSTGALAVTTQKEVATNTRIISNNITDHGAVQIMADVLNVYRLFHKCPGSVQRGRHARSMSSTTVSSLTASTIKPERAALRRESEPNLPRPSSPVAPRATQQRRGNKETLSQSHIRVILFGVVNASAISALEVEGNWMSSRMIERIKEAKPGYLKPKSSSKCFGTSYKGAEFRSTGQYVDLACCAVDQALACQHSFHIVRAKEEDFDLLLGSDV